jgi:hypothetical protein
MIDSDRISGITFSAPISILSSKGSRFNLFLYESEALLNTSDLIWKFTDQHHYTHFYDREALAEFIDGLY